MSNHWVVTYLVHNGEEHTQHPDLTVKKTVNPTREAFDALYSGVGRDFEWDDLHAEGGAAMDRYLSARDRYVTTLMDGHRVAGFYALSTRAPQQIDLDYFGLMPDAIGQGLGGQLLEHAIAEAFVHHAAQKLYVNTCTLDHPRALPLYKAKGFVVRFTESYRDLPEYQTPAS